MGTEVNPMIGFLTGKITPIKKEYVSASGPNIASSLTKEGLNRAPNTAVTLMPYKEKDGSYRTGLDPNAWYIKQLARTNEVAAEIERTRVTKFLEYAKSISGIDDLGPRSEYYKEMFNSELYGSGVVAEVAMLFDKKNLFDMQNPQHALTFFWLRVHPDIAPSYEAYLENRRSSRCPSPMNCSFFVEDEEVESKITYERNVTVDKALGILSTMSPSKQKKIAVLLGLPVSYDDKSEVVYNELSEYIKDSLKSNRQSANVRTFISLNELSEDVFGMRYFVKEALFYNIYRTGKGGVIYRGKQDIAQSEEELVKYLSDPDNQEEYLAAKTELDSKKRINE